MISSIYFPLIKALLCVLFSRLETSTQPHSFPSQIHSTKRFPFRDTEHVNKDVSTKSVSKSIHPVTEDNTNNGDDDRQSLIPKEDNRSTDYERHRLSLNELNQVRRQ